MIINVKKLILATCLSSGLVASNVYAAELSVSVDGDGAEVDATVNETDPLEGVLEGVESPTTGGTPDVPFLGGVGFNDSGSPFLIPTRDEDGAPILIPGIEALVPDGANGGVVPVPALSDQLLGGPLPLFDVGAITGPAVNLQQDLPQTDVNGLPVIGLIPQTDGAPLVGSVPLGNLTAEIPEAIEGCRGFPDLRRRALFLNSNEITGNRVFAWYRDCEGKLYFAGAFQTGGVGSALGFASNGLNGGYTQDGMVQSPDGRLLFLTHNGANQIVSAKINQNSVEVVDRVSAGGLFPSSLAVNQATRTNRDGGVLYMASRDDGNLVGFTVSRTGELEQIPRSRRVLSEGRECNVGQISFTPDESKLVASCRQFESLAVASLSKWIDVFTVRNDWTLVDQVPNDAVGYEPFGFQFSDDGFLLMTEGNFITPFLGQVSTYRINDDNTLTVVNGGVRTFQGDTCWIAYGSDGNVWTSQFNDSSISSLRYEGDGKLRLLDSVAGWSSPQGAAVPAGLDLELTKNNDFIYQLNIPNGISGFKTNRDGSLTPVEGVSGVAVPVSAWGMAVR